MSDFLQRFGSPDPEGAVTSSGGKYGFSDVRSGLIVGLVSQ